MNKLNKIGPNLLPCKTPRLIVNSGDRNPATTYVTSDPRMDSATRAELLWFPLLHGGENKRIMYKNKYNNCLFFLCSVHFILPADNVLQIFNHNSNIIYKLKPLENGDYKGP